MRWYGTHEPLEDDELHSLFFDALLNLKATDWEFIEFFNEYDTVESSILAAERWPEIMQVKRTGQLNWIVWRLFDCCTGMTSRILREHYTQDDVDRILRAAYRITLTIPDIHEKDEPMGNGFFMLWDVLSSFFEPDLQPYLAALLKEYDPRIHYAALHGLGHTNDGRIPIIMAFLKKWPQYAADPFVQQCIDGTVM